MRSPDGDAQKRIKHFSPSGEQPAASWDLDLLFCCKVFSSRIGCSSPRIRGQPPPLLFFSSPGRFPRHLTARRNSAFKCHSMPCHAMPCHSRQQDCRRGKTWLAIFIPILFAFEGMKQYCYRGLFHFLKFPECPSGKILL